MAAMLDDVLGEGKDYAQFMLHSSELMPGGSPRFRTDESVEALYRDIEFLFDTAGGRFREGTLKEYHGFRAGE
jgi:hypothetical protein